MAGYFRNKVSILPIISNFNLIKGVRHVFPDPNAALAVRKLYLSKGLMVAGINDAHQYSLGMGVKGKVSIRLLFLLPGYPIPILDYAQPGVLWRPG